VLTLAGKHVHGVGCSVSLKGCLYKQFFSPGVR
jgi:hypothetical protein